MHTLQSYEYDQRPFYSEVSILRDQAGQSIMAIEDSAPLRRADNSERSFYFKREKTRTDSPGFRSSILITGMHAPRITRRRSRRRRTCPR
ncbi:protein of unknown function [Burkholderia multivorans]